MHISGGGYDLISGGGYDLISGGGYGLISGGGYGLISGGGYDLMDVPQRKRGGWSPRTRSQGCRCRTRQTAGRRGSCQYRCIAASLGGGGWGGGGEGASGCKKI